MSETGSSTPGGVRSLREQIGRYDAVGEPVIGVCECLDCGALVKSRDIHDRFHAILNQHARALAVLTNAHPELRGRIGRNDNNWSAEAFTVVAGGLCDSQWHEIRRSKRADRCPLCGAPNYPSSSDDSAGAGS